eukprot:scaffold61668_cov69-Attheya_sp.AAC.5
MLSTPIAEGKNPPTTDASSTGNTIMKRGMIKHPRVVRTRPPLYKAPPNKKRKPKLKTGVVPVGGNTEQCMYNRVVCFDLESEIGQLILQQYIQPPPQQALVRIGHQRFLFASLAQHKDIAKYKVEWEHTGIVPKHIKIEHTNAFHAYQLAEKMTPLRHQAEMDEEDQQSQASYKKFLCAYGPEENIESPFDSDGDETDDEDTIFDEECDVAKSIIGEYTQNTSSISRLQNNDKSRLK